MSFERGFVDQSRELLAGEYLPKIRACVSRLTAADLWWRPNATSNSVGHLLLHLSGNLRQWVVTGLGGQEDVRHRHLEFAPEHQPEARDLVDDLAQTVAAADAVLEALTPSTLAERRVIQGMNVTGFEALYHVVEHFAGHTGQIIYVTKLRTGRDLEFYAVEDGVARSNW